MEFEEKCPKCKRLITIYVITHPPHEITEQCPLCEAKITWPVEREIRLGKPTYED